MSVEPIHLSVKLIHGVDDELIEWSNSAARKGIIKSTVVKNDLKEGIRRRNGEDSYNDMIIARLDKIEAMLKKLSSEVVVKPVRVREVNNDPLLEEI